MDPVKPFNNNFPFVWTSVALSLETIAREGTLQQSITQSKLEPTCHLFPPHLWFKMTKFIEFSLYHKFSNFKPMSVIVWKENCLWEFSKLKWTGFDGSYILTTTQLPEFARREQLWRRKKYPNTQFGSITAPAMISCWPASFGSSPWSSTWFSCYWEGDHAIFLKTPLILWQCRQSNLASTGAASSCTLTHPKRHILLLGPAIFKDWPSAVSQGLSWTEARDCTKNGTWGLGATDGLDFHGVAFCCRCLQPEHMKPTC
jgi:hypothetical protein